MASRAKRTTVKKSKRRQVDVQPGETQGFFQSILENSPNAVVVVDKEGTIRYESPSMENVLGYRIQDRIGANFLDLVHPEDVTEAADAFSELVQYPEQSMLREIRLRHADGSWRKMQAYGKNLLDDPAVRGIVAGLLDITKLSQHEEAQRETEAWCSALVENARDGIDIVQDGVCKFANKALAEITGYSNEEFEGRDILDFVHPEHKERTLTRYEGRLKGTITPSYLELKIRRKDGEVRDVEASGTVIQYQGRPAIMGIIRDVTEREQANEQLRSSREQLRNLSAHLEDVREEERTRISRMIHDDLGQILAALKIDLSWMNSRIDENQKSLLKKIKEMRRLTDIAIGRVRSISTELRPGLLDDLGLVAAVEWLANEFRNRTGINCQPSLEIGDTEIDRDHATAFFRVLQEALTNVAMHSKATKVRISLLSQGGNMVLEIKDNGRGITQEQICDSRSFGLIGMRERANLWGGDFKISGVQGKGTTVIFSIPITKKQAPRRQKK